MERSGSVVRTSCVLKLMGTWEAEADKNCHELKLLIVDPQSAMPAAS